MNIKFRAEPMIVFIILVFLPFEDSWLQATPLGYAGASLAIIPILILLVLKTVTGQISKSFILYLGYSILLSSLFAFVYQDLPVETLIDRGSRAFILYSLYFFAFIYFKHTKVDISKASIALVSIIGSSLLLTLVAPDYLNSISPLHYSDTSNYRPRGYSIEASTFGYIVISSILLLCWLKNINTYIGLGLSLGCALLVNSKGAMIGLLLAWFVYLMLSGNKNLISKVIGLIFVTIAAFIAVPLLAAIFQSDFDEYTSTATRSTMAILSVMSIFHSPLGHGFTGYLPYINYNGQDSIYISKIISPIPLNYSEVSNYFTAGAYKSVGAKSFVFDSIIIFGMPFLIYFFSAIKKGRRLSIIINSPSRDILFYYTIISLVFYIPGIGGYISAVILGICLNRHITKVSK
ncbi:hypothetical protein [Pseudomonas sp. R5(2019)]|uniref:hypothetical protein n=1 Tax=Pseudomonas sp. R5(2019) TaxID=2697566 RepID=UPI00141322F7|nr:hypothetical protein [Pseudomonas sp. R5(2019)]NBA98229.1 hypothetical protein [Pseudomonas sp. R5(2019)]